MKRLIAVVAIAVTVLAGCGSADSGSWTNYDITVPMTTGSKNVWAFNASDSSSSGVLQLNGTGDADGSPVNVSLWGLINYTNNAGVFAESIEFDFGSTGKVYAYTRSGETTRTPTGVHVAAILRISGGTGDFVGATGTVTHSADRAAKIGSPLTAHFVLHLKRA